MDFNFTEEQRILRKTARDFLEGRCPISSVLEMEKDEKGFDEALWKEMAELGWTALIVPEEYGGVGGDLMDLVVMFEEIGRVCLPSPFFSTIALGSVGLIEAAGDELKKQLLPKIARGEIKLSFALEEAGFKIYNRYSVETKAIKTNGGYNLTGTKLFVPYAHVADYVICVARSSGYPPSRDGLSLFLVDPKDSGITIRPLVTVSGEKQFALSMSNVSLGKEALLGEPDKGGFYLDVIHSKATICKCAEMLGGAQKVLEMASNYAKEREQFGRPIGSFQAIQHHCANMLIDIEGSRYLLYKTAWMLSRGINATMEVSACKAWVSEAFKRVVRLGHQVQGATAFMIEHAMPLYSRRANMAEILLGDARYHREIVASQIGL
jgi:alkylation response protein AidB-like acyl-CoA dehydrogenase